MNSIKIIIAVIVLVTIGVGVYFWVQNIKSPEKIKEAENQFTRKIEQEIEQLIARPDSHFCKDFYTNILYHIQIFYDEKRFSNNQLENDQWKENLERNLYSAYAQLFIRQAITVFNDSAWNSNDLSFIQSEKNVLKKSEFLLADSPVDKDFASIQTALNKYNEIQSFIMRCQDYSYLETILQTQFPISDVESKISRANNLLKNHLENEYVNNCRRVHDELKDIPQVLFNKHVKYLDNKIKYWSEQYPNYTSQRDYSNNLYMPLKAEIDALDNNIYNVSNFNVEYNRLLSIWSADNSNAYKYKYQ